MTTTIFKKCPFCGKINSVEVDMDAYESWRNGTLIQDAMPELTPDEREILISGICSACWDAM